MEFVIALTLILVMTLFTAIIFKQQRTIERLTDRLMARNYKEYASMTQTPQVTTKELRKPMSWFDDPTIEEPAKEGD